MLEGLLERESEARNGPTGNEARNEDAFVRFADRELHRAYRLTGLILGNQHDAEDATQDALLKA